MTENTVNTVTPRRISLFLRVHLLLLSPASIAGWIALAVGVSLPVLENADAFPWPQFAGVLINLAGVGLIILTIAYLRGLRQIHLITTGTLTEARLVGQREISEEDAENRLVSVAYTYAFTASEGRIHEAKTQAQTPWGRSFLENSPQYFVYDPSRSERHYLLCDMPGRPYISEPGIMRCKLGIGTVITVFVPMISLLLCWSFAWCTVRIAWYLHLDQADELYAYIRSFILSLLPS